MPRSAFSLAVPLRESCKELPLNTKINSPRLFLHVFDTANFAMSTTIGGAAAMDLPGTVMENFSGLGNGIRWSDWHRTVSSVVEPRSVRSLSAPRHSERVSKQSFCQYLHLARRATLSGQRVTQPKSELCALIKLSFLALLESFLAPKLRRVKWDFGRKIYRHIMS